MPDLFYSFGRVLVMSTAERTLVIPADPTPAELARLLVECDARLEAVGRLITTCRAEVKAAKHACTVVKAHALLVHRDMGTSALVKACVELDPQVEEKTRAVLDKEAKLGLALEEKEALENHFITLRKLVELAKARLDRLR